MPAQLDEVGLHFVVGLSTTHLTLEEEQLLAELRPSGIILFSHNIDRQSGAAWPEALYLLIESARAAIGRDRIIVAIDHEGGAVQRLPAPVSHFPAAFCWGDQAADVGQAMGRELRLLGCNLNFAPVIDVLSNSENSVIGKRAFSSDPQEVAERGLAFLKAMESAGVFGCLKHFPGHGSTRADSHVELPVVSASVAELVARDIRPFRALLDQTSMVMTAHVLYSELDPDYPATLSQRIIHELLREEFNYSGVVITDDLGMGALSGISSYEIARRVLLADVDLLLVGKAENEIPLAMARRLAEEMLELFAKSELGEAHVLDSRQRVQRFLAKLPAAGAKIHAELENCCMRNLELVSALGRKKNLALN